MCPQCNELLVAQVVILRHLETAYLVRQTGLDLFSRQIG